MNVGSNSSSSSSTHMTDVQVDVQVDLQETMGNPMDPYRIEHWCEYLKDFTFETALVSLSLAQARAVIKFRELHKMHSQIISWEYMNQDMTSGGTINFKTADDFRQQVDTRVRYEMEKEGGGHIEALHAMNASLQEIIERWGGGIFVRLSTRSPKDSALSSQQMKTLLRESIASSTIQNPDSNEAKTEDLNAFTNACCWSLRVETAEQATDLLLHSNRVFEDLVRCELALDDESKWKMDLVVRKWWPKIYAPFEFRVFVYNGEITAIVQYYSLCYSAKMNVEKERIKEAIYSCWGKFRHSIPMEGYTVDFAISEDLEHVKVVELNHLPPKAGTSLFDWKSEADRMTIANGPFEFRIRDRPLDHNKEGLQDIHKPLLVYINQLRSRADPKSPAPKPGRRCLIS